MAGLIAWSIGPNTWNVAGGPGSLSSIDGRLVVRQTGAVHRRIEAFLAGLTLLQNESDRRAPIEADIAERRIPSAIAAALESPVTLDCRDVPLEVFVAKLSSQAGIEIHVGGAFARWVEEMKDADVPLAITGRFDGVPLRTVLKSVTLAGGVGLVHYVQNGKLRLAHSYYAERDSSKNLRIYPLTGLLPDDDVSSEFASGEYWDQADMTPLSLAGAVVDSVEPHSWRKFGGNGAADVYFGPLGAGIVVSNSHQVHRKVQRLMARLRGPMPEPTNHGELLDDSPLRQRIEAILADAADEPLTGLSLRRACDRLARRHRLNIAFDERALMLIDHALDRPIAVQPAGDSLEAVLLNLPASVGSPERLGIVVRGDAVLIATEDVVFNWENVETRLYNVRGLDRRFAKVPEPPVVQLNRFRLSYSQSRLPFDQDSGLGDLAVLFAGRSNGNFDPSAGRAAFLGDVMLLARSREGHRGVERFLGAIRQALADMPTPDEFADGFDRQEIGRLRRLLAPDRPPAVRASAAYLIAGADDPPAELIDPIVALLSADNASESQRLQPIVFLALRRYGQTAGRAAPAVAAQWPTTAGLERRSWLIRTLARLGPDAAEPLIGLFSDPQMSKDDVNDVCVALDNMGRNAAAAVPALLGCISLDVKADEPILQTLQQIDPQGDGIRRHLAERMNRADPAARERAFKLQDYLRFHFGDL